MLNCSVPPAGIEAVVYVLPSTAPVESFSTCTWAAPAIELVLVMRTKDWNFVAPSPAEDCAVLISTLKPPRLMEATAPEKAGGAVCTTPAAVGVTVRVPAETWRTPVFVELKLM